MRGLIGSGNYCSIKPTDMGKDFALGNLPDTTAILVDEISVTEPIDSIDILKTLATRDASVTTQRKFHDPRTVRWDGNMVFCCNGFAKIPEKQEQQKEDSTSGILPSGLPELPIRILFRMSW